MASFTYQFDQLPLHEDGGLYGAEIDGYAEISFGMDGDWCISGISIDVWKPLHKARTVQIERGTALYGLIMDALDRREWQKRIEEAVADEIIMVRDLRAEAAADLWHQLKLEDRP